MTKRVTMFTACGLACCMAANLGFAQLNVVATAGTGETVQGVLSNQQGLARTADGRLWAMTYFNDGKNNNAQSQFDRIYVSSDNGQTWTLATTTRTQGSVRGSLRTDNDGTTLHVAWQANDSTSATAFYSVYYATYDTIKGAWNGTDTQLAKGVDANNQYQVPDVAVTPKGTVVVCYYGHRQSPSWSGRMRVFKNNQWSAERRVNADTYGIMQDVQVHGEDVFFAYRTNSGLYGIRCRRFDTENDAWGTEGEMQVSQANPTNTDPASSGNNLVVTPNGDIYVIYAKGKSSAGSGQIWVGISPAGQYKFTTHLKIDDDASLQGGNFTYYGYGLALTGDLVNVIYSKLSETNSKLYLRWITNGQVLPPIPITLASGATKEFDFVSAHRNNSGAHGLMALVTDRGTTGGRVQAYVRAGDGAVVFHGTGCAGTLSDTPYLGSTSLPSLGGRVDCALSQLPKTTPGVLFLGLNARMLGPIPLPLPLDALGLTGCKLVQDVVVPIGYASKADGTAAVQIPLPNDPRLSGVPIYFQSFVVAPQATPGNAVMSNGIAATAR